MIFLTIVFQLIVRNLMDKWMQFCDGDSEPILSDLKNHGYQSTLDLPMICFFDDIMKEFPDAKVLLTVRDSPKAWVKVRLYSIFFCKIFRRIIKISRNSVIPKYSLANSRATILLWSQCFTWWIYWWSVQSQT